MSDVPWNNSLGEMFTRARREGLWFHCGYQDLWFSPDELEKAQASGRFRWGAVNWELRDPKEQVEYLKRKAQSAADEAASFVAKVATP